MFVVPSGYAFPLFALLSLLLWLVIYVRQQETRHHQLWISQFALLGAPLLNWWYADFWQPHPHLVVFVLSSMLFGWSFLGSVSALTIGRRVLVRDMSEDQSPTSRYRVLKYATLMFGVLAAFFFYFGTLRMTSVTATTLGMMTTAVLVMMLRPELILRTLWGGVISVILLTTLLGLFLGLLTGNGHALGLELSTFYAKHGSRVTGLELACWAFAFGALFGPFVIWAKNLRYLRE